MAPRSPGTGKTTEMLSRIASIAKRGVHPAGVYFASFTKAAAQEATSRIGMVKSDNFSTIHSLCYRLTQVHHAAVVDYRKLRELVQITGVQITGGRGSDNDELSDGDLYLQVINFANNRMISLEEAYETSQRPGVFDEFIMFATTYAEWKKAYGFIDFNDMLKRTLGPGVKFEASHLIIDEAQDLSPLQWAVVDRLIELADPKEVHISGDDDQCQPGTTKVVVGGADIEISNIKNGDKILSYNRTGGCFEYRSVKVASRDYEGDLITVRCEGKKSSYTPNHKCMVTYNYDPNTRVVYLMRKGNRFRVGQTKAFKWNKSTGTVSLYPVVRVRQEGADDFWILAVHDNECDAYINEQFISVKYGIPQTIFNARGIGLRTKYEVDVWGALEGIDLLKRATDLLQACGKDIRYPHIKHNGGAKHFMCYAINVVAGFHKMATKVDGILKWGDISVSRQSFSGRVYSLSVDKTATYMADGIYTHNCIHGFAGAEAHGMAEFSDRYRAEQTVLAQSWRIPRSVHGVAGSVIGRVDRRVSKQYNPRTEEGQVNYSVDINSLDIQHGENTMVLGRTHSVLKDVEDLLRDRAIPFVKAGGVSLFTNRFAMSIRAVLKARRGESISDHEYKALLKTVCNPKIRGEVECGDYSGLAKCDWRHTIDIPFSLMSYYEEVDIEQEPTVTLSTIHGSKGKEADRVVLLTKQTPRIMEVMGTTAGADDEHRCMYVGVTRAKHKLDVIIDDEGYPI